VLEFTVAMRALAADHALLAALIKTVDDADAERFASC
jgi:hypothetical protein